MEERLEKLGPGMEIYTLPSHPITTDSLLLSHFIEIKPGQELCDLGTGCGILPFILLRMQPDLFVTGVEIQESAVSLCRRSITHNKLQDRFTLIHHDLRDLGGLVPGNRFDVVCMNPPYKSAGAGLQNGDERRRLARHEQGCSYREIVKAAARILMPMGRFAICHRAERVTEILRETEQAGLYVKRLRMVHQRADTPCKLFLMEARKGANPGTQILPPLIICGEGGGYTEEVEKIYCCYGGKSDR